MDGFTDKTVLITGASSGIGSEFARQLAAKQANLILTARTEPALQQLAANLSNTHKLRIEVMPADLSQPNGPQELAKKIEASGMQVDVVINNAGFGKWGPFRNYDLETYDAMCRLNMNAVVALTYLFLPGMLERKRGGFINVASTAGFQPIPYFAAYSATKAFVINLSEALWREYRDRGITVTCLCPGGTDTPFHEVSKIDRRKLMALQPAEEVARVGLEAFLRGKPTVISGFKNYLLANAVRFAPRRLVVAVSEALFKPR